MTEVVPQQTPSPRRRYAWALFVILGLVVYASLAPFEFQPIGVVEAIERFRTLRVVNPAGATAGGGNGPIYLGLYLALGFAAMGALSSGRPGTRRGLAALGVLAAGVVLAVVLEASKFASPPRVPSLYYVLLEWIGLATGVLGCLVIGEARIQAAHEPRGSAKSRWLPGGLLALYLFVILSVQLWPFDFRFGRAVIVRKYVEGRLRILPFGSVEDEVYWLTSWNQLGAARTGASPTGPADSLLESPAGSSIPSLDNQKPLEESLISGTTDPGRPAF